MTACAIRYQRTTSAAVVGPHRSHWAVRDGGCAANCHAESSMSHQIGNPTMAVADREVSQIATGRGSHSTNRRNRLRSIKEIVP